MASAAASPVNQNAPIHPAVILLFAIGISRVFFSGNFRTRQHAVHALRVRAIGDGVVAIACSYLRLLPQSLVPFWDVSTRMLSKWHTLLPAPSPKYQGVYDALLFGPLGTGASKVIHVLVAFLLWRLLKNEWPVLHVFGDHYPGFFEWSILAGISLGVNGVLYAWSRILKSRGNHDGVNRMVASSSKEGNDYGPSYRQRLLYLSLAFLNATCEEITFRFFWKAEFSTYLTSNGHANLAQAAVFGALHYYGVPSGLTGVALTFVYGWIMGVLYEHIGGGGLFLPVVAHTIADYYIFSTVAHGKTMGTKVKA